MSGPSRHDKYGVYRDLREYNSPRWSAALVATGLWAWWPFYYLFPPVDDADDVLPTPRPDDVYQDEPSA